MALPCEGTLALGSENEESAFLKRFYLFISREMEREGERGKEKHQCVVASHTPPTGDLGPQPKHVP